VEGRGRFPLSCVVLVNIWLHPQCRRVPSVNFVAIMSEWFHVFTIEDSDACNIETFVTFLWTFIFSTQKQILKITINRLLPNCNLSSSGDEDDTSQWKLWTGIYVKCIHEQGGYFLHNSKNIRNRWINIHLYQLSIATYPSGAVGFTPISYMELVFLNPSKIGCYCRPLL
jgi:hypothetical protein